ncbi:MAG: glycosyltransferase family 39 protein [Planctomycetes bacterium]|nr:glycosyltransferase family 39 protein [Planctomycetota bacterium]MBI3835171.1 glycosyltransferase family 39 protein [Planctomycetota bacterium]
MNTRPIQPDREPTESTRELFLPRRVFWLTTIVAIAANAFSLASNHLWGFPDSIDYIQLAGGIVRSFDLTNELYLVRTPGYPLFLAACFATLGTASAAAILLLQHLMLIATAILTAAIGWRLTQDRRIAVLGGLVCASSPQLLAYANMALTETPYTLCFTACIYLLIRYAQCGCRRWLCAASFLTGIAYLLRPVGLILIGVCVIAVLIRCVSSSNATKSKSFTEMFRVFVSRAAIAVAPTVAVAAPWMLLSAQSHHSLQASRCLDYVLYFRAVTTENFTDDSSPALREIRDTVNAAIRDGHLPPDANYRERGIVMKAYQAIRGQSFTESSAVMGRAGRELLMAHPWRVAMGTVKYSAWMLMSPDPVIQFLPGGAPGVNGMRDTRAEIYGIETYSRGAGSWEPTLARYSEFLPLETAPRVATPAFTKCILSYERAANHPLTRIGIRRTPYELLTCISCLGIVIGLASGRRGLWTIVATALILQIGVSAFLGGPQTRYASPATPLLALGLASSLIMMIRKTLFFGSRLTELVTLSIRLPGTFGK